MRFMTLITSAENSKTGESEARQVIQVPGSRASAAHG